MVPPDYTFMSSDHGVHVFANGVTFNTAGSQSLTATDTGTTSVTGSAAVLVNTLHFSVSAPGSATAGSPVSFIVTALDQSNNTATAYTGTVAFTTSDSQALLSVVHRHLDERRRRFRRHTSKRLATRPSPPPTRRLPASPVPAMPFSSIRPLPTILR